MGRESGVATGGESENSEGYKRGQGRERERERERERATFTVFCYTGVGRQRHDIFSRLQKRVS
jgi:hypothetical protein